MKYLFFLFFLFQILLSGLVNAEMILSKGLEKGNCSPCKLKDKDKNEFKLFTYINAETKYITSIKINNKVFKLGSDLEIYPDTFPLFFS